MTAVERIRAYGALGSEEDAARLAAQGQHLFAAPPAAWPTRGEVVFEDLCLRYRPELPEVGASVGICPVCRTVQW
jgi:hypothetical protein